MQTLGNLLNDAHESIAHVKVSHWNAETITMESDDAIALMSAVLVMIENGCTFVSGELGKVTLHSKA